MKMIKRLAAVLTLAVAAGAAWADDDAKGHWYLGGSTGYFKPDTHRESSGNHRTAGLQFGYQFSRAWSIDVGYQENSWSPGKDDLEMYDLNFIRHWGDDVRLLFLFGYTHINMDLKNPSTVDNSGAGWHAGLGASAFLTDNLELRGVAKVVYTNDDRYTDGMGTLSLNYHFGSMGNKPQRRQATLGESNRETLPPIQNREPIQAAPAPAKPEPKVTYTLINFDSNSIDIESQYGSQLDEISTEIKDTDSRAVIEGHTDSIGSDEYNQYLSQDRAIMVKRELKKRGVNGDDLHTEGYGESRPVADNETTEGRAKNRRVEVKVFDKE